jgi:hypothetical protein
MNTTPNTLYNWMSYNNNHYMPTEEIINGVDFLVMYIPLQFENTSKKTIKGDVQLRGYIPKSINIYDRGKKDWVARVVVLDPHDIRTKMSLL